MVQIEIISKETIKPTCSTPVHLRNFKFSLLDQIGLQSYVPIILLYTSPDFGTNIADYKAVSNNLKNSLSKTLTSFYPLCGELNGNVSIDCNDQGAVFVEAKANVPVSEILKNTEINTLSQLLPFHPYGEEQPVITGVQVNGFECGSLAIGVCISHKIADGATMASFLTAWAAISRNENTFVPCFESSMYFPPKIVDINIRLQIISKAEKIATRRFEFNGKSMAKLKANKLKNCNPTSVEAITALIWKCAMEAAKVNSGKEKLPPSSINHAVNIRRRMDPPMPENSVGNLWLLAVTPCLAEMKEVELDKLVNLLRESIRKIDNDYVDKFRGDDNLENILQTMKGIMELKSRGVKVYSFTSHVRFPFYDVDFGWGKPERVSTVAPPTVNVILMGTKCDDGIEAWVTLTEEDMVEFERNQELLEFVSAIY